MIMPLTPATLLSVPLPGELWPVGPLRTQHVNFLEREIVTDSDRDRLTMTSRSEIWHDDSLDDIG